MANKALLKYIKDVRKKGFSDREISAKLKESGYTDEEIKEGMGEPPLASGNADKPTKNPVKKRKKVILFSILFVICLLMLFIFARPFFISLISMGNPNSFEIIDISYCNGISPVEEFTNCLMNQSPRMEINATADCELINNSEMVLLCNAILSGKTEDCQKTFDPKYCYSLQVRARSSRLRCLSIEDETYKSNCLVNYDQEEKIAQYNEYLFIFKN